MRERVDMSGMRFTKDFPPSLRIQRITEDYISYVEMFDADIAKAEAELEDLRADRAKAQEALDEWLPYAQRALAVEVNE
jgi:hypothetical protein